MKNYELLIFDLDGTLLDTTEGVIKSVKEAVDHYGLPQLTDAQYMSFNGPPMKQSLIRWFELDDQTADEVTEYYRTLYKNSNYKYAKKYDNLDITLQVLKSVGYTMGVATYKRTDYAVDILRHFGIIRFFDLILGDTAGSKRTKADIIRAVCDELSVSPDKALMIGDTEGDRNGAANAGVDFLGVTYGYGFQPEEEHTGFLTVKKPLELVKLLGERSRD